MTHPQEPQDPDRWARLRFAIVGPLLAAPPLAGQLGTCALKSTRFTQPQSSHPI